MSVDVDSTPTEEQRKQSRTFSVILYQDAENYCCDEVLANCAEYFDEWAYILHDKDLTEDGTPKKNHYHVVGRLSGSRSPSTVANKIGVPANYVECKKGYTFKKGVRYLCHLDNPDKFQYDSGLISSNVELGLFLNPFNDVSQATAIYNKIICENVDNIYTLVEWVFQEGCYSEFRRGYFIWKDLIKANKENFEKERLGKHD